MEKKLTPRNMALSLVLALAMVISLMPGLTQSAYAAMAYFVRVDSSITNGTVTVDNEKDYYRDGETITLTVTPNEGYRLKELNVNKPKDIETVSELVGLMGDATFDDGGNNTLKIVDGKFTVFMDDDQVAQLDNSATLERQGNDYKASDNGVDWNFYCYGETLPYVEVKLTIGGTTWNLFFQGDNTGSLPAGDAVATTKVDDKTYTFTMPESDVRVRATFEKENPEPTPTPEPTPAEDTSKPVLVAKGIASGKNAVNISWNKVSGADKYAIYFAKCNTKGKKYTCKKVKTVSAKTLKFKKTKLKKKTAYKFYVVALDKSGKKIDKSLTGHFYTGNTKGKYTNPKSIKLSKSSYTLKEGQTATIKASVSKVKSSKKLATNHAKKLRYTSNNPTVATVSASGKITAKSAGTATIYVQTINGIWKTCKVVVTKESQKAVAVTGVSLDKTTLDMNVDDEPVALTATVAPANATNKEVTWSSSDESIATVDANGNVTAVSTGTATITVKTVDGNKTATCDVSVIKGHIKWAVQLHSTDDGTITFWPAMGNSYGSKCDNDKCINTASWAEIKATPSDYEDCITKGCTKTVTVDETSNNDIFRGSYGQEAGMFYDTELTSDGGKWSTTGQAENPTYTATLDAIKAGSNLPEGATLGLLTRAEVQDVQRIIWNSHGDASYWWLADTTGNSAYGVNSGGDIYSGPSNAGSGMAPRFSY